MNNSIQVLKQYFSFCIKQILSRSEGQVFNFPCIAANIFILFFFCNALREQFKSQEQRQQRAAKKCATLISTES